MAFFELAWTDQASCYNEEQRQFLTTYIDTRRRLRMAVHWMHNSGTA